MKGACKLFCSKYSASFCFLINAYECAMTIFVWPCREDMPEAVTTYNCELAAEIGQLGLGPQVRIMSWKELFSPADTHLFASVRLTRAHFMIQQSHNIRHKEQSNMMTC